MTARPTPLAEVPPEQGPDPAPAAQGIGTDNRLPCPLCDYDLRGLTEPRCPECGYAFEWPDLLNPSRRKHPYLFEHHPRRNLRSFSRTMLGGLRPARFWSSLKPSQPSRPGRLILYWLIANLLLPIGYAGFFAYTAVTEAKRHEANRKSQFVWLTRNLLPLGDAGFLAEIKAAGGPQGWVDKQFPPTRSPRYLAYVYEWKFQPHLFPNEEPGQHLEVFVVLLAWPWLTLATLLIFQTSMRRAKVNAVHVLRCAVYCCDASAWLGTLTILAASWAMNVTDVGRYVGFRDAAVAAPLFALVTAWRLSAAYRHYLQFDRPAATAAASQVVVTLAVWVLLYAGVL